MKNELPVYFSFQISCVIIHLLTTKSLFAHGEHIFCVGEYVFTKGESGLTHYKFPDLLKSIYL